MARVRVGRDGRQRFGLRAAPGYLISLFDRKPTSAILNLIMSLRMGQSALSRVHSEGKPTALGDHELGKVEHSLDYV